MRQANDSGGDAIREVHRRRDRAGTRAQHDAIAFPQVERGGVGGMDPDLVAAWTRSYAGVNDLAAWERQLSLMSPTSPLWSAAQSEVRRLRADYGLDSAGTEGVDRTVTRP